MLEFQKSQKYHHTLIKKQWKTKVEERIILSHSGGEGMENLSTCFQFCVKKQVANLIYILRIYTFQEQP